MTHTLKVLHTHTHQKFSFYDLLRHSCSNMGVNTPKLKKTRAVMVIWNVSFLSKSAVNRQTSPHRRCQKVPCHYHHSEPSPGPASWGPSPACGRAQPPSVRSGAGPGLLPGGSECEWRASLAVQRVTGFLMSTTSHGKR